MKRLLLILVLLFPVNVFAQSAASPLVMPRKQFFDASGNPLAFGKVYTYVAGSSTPQATYTDATGDPLAVNTNPVTLDAGGFASIYVKCSDSPYKIVVKNSLLVTQWTEDGVQYPGCNGSGFLQSLNGLTVGTQVFSTGTAGTDFNIQSSIDAHVFNIPDASATARGLISTGAGLIAGPKTLTGNTLIDNDLYVTGNISTDHPIEITGETCATAEANVGLFGFNTTTGLPCYSYDGGASSSGFSRLNDILNPADDTGSSLAMPVTVDPGGDITALSVAANRTSTDAGVYTVTGVEGVARSRSNGANLTIRGGHFRTYVDDTLSGTAVTSIGLDGSARASGAVVAAPGTAFIGIRSWMAPGFTAPTLSNVTNFHAFWAYNESATQAVTNAYFANDAGGGYTYGFSLYGANIAATGGQFRLSNDVRIYTGAQTTRDNVRGEVGTSGAIGSVYLSTAGKIYLKVANADATADWERVTTTAAD